ncbi:hypothetical protein [Clostridium sp. UBA4548]|uniref:hypothetical protein n=1 Tax=Clostridium sp. UBA4548 TaxID=1946361 RepID=UPI0025C0886B|nr:hypothetical protein [Clostridium sp. UBA4548]
MSGLWENCFLLRIGNTIFIIIALVTFFSIIVKFFKSLFGNHSSSESVWKNIVIYICGFSIVYLSGVALISAVGNGYIILELQGAIEALEKGASYKVMFIKQVQGNFQYIINKLIQLGVVYFLYIKVAKSINLEIEKLRERVVRWDLKNKF